MVLKGEFVNNILVDGKQTGGTERKPCYTCNRKGFMVERYK
jgi:hypothetical protein